MLTAGVAQAGENTHGSPGNSSAGNSFLTSLAGANAISGASASGGTASASNGSNSVNIQGDNYEARRIPVSSAVAPDIYNSVVCPIVSQGSHAVQFLFFGGSTSGNVSINSICVAYHLKQADVVERMTCNASKEYREANPACDVK